MHPSHVEKSCWGSHHALGISPSCHDWSGDELHFSRHERVITLFYLVLMLENMNFWVVLASQFLPIKSLMCIGSTSRLLLVNRTSAVIHSFHSQDSEDQLGFTSTFIQDELLRPCWPISWKKHEKNMYWVAGGTTPKWFGIAKTFWIRLANTIIILKIDSFI